MERREMKSRRPEFCPSCSKAMMSYVNTMQEFLDKVVEDIEGNSPSLRSDEGVPKPLVQDLTASRRRLPSRQGQMPKAVASPVPQISPPKTKNQIPFSETTKDTIINNQERPPSLQTDNKISDDYIRDKNVLASQSTQIASQDKHFKYEQSISSSVNGNLQTGEIKHHELPTTNNDVTCQHSSFSTQIKHPDSQNQSLSEQTLVTSESTNAHEYSYPASESNKLVLGVSKKPSYQSKATPPQSPSKSYDTTPQHPSKPEKSPETPLEPDKTTPPEPPLEPHKATPPEPSLEPHKTTPPEPPSEKATPRQPSSESDKASTPTDQFPPSVVKAGETFSLPLEEPNSPEVPLPPTWVEDMLKICDIPLLIPPTYEREAYVTMANNNLTAIGALVLGNSLRLSGTKRTLAILVSEDVTDEIRNILGSVFHVVHPISSLEPMGSTKLSLLEQPELGITYLKLLVWRLTQFEKCVFLSPDTLVIQNCDELFERNEISAVPDIGWPDCFNTGVFVYVPSDETFWDLVHFAETKGSFDGGEQGLLNMYFRSWSLDINKRLPFIYNLMANVCYTYGPAFVRFGGNAKIVHFFGTTKPWNVQFNIITGQVAPFSGVHPTFAHYVQYWLTIFARCVLPLFSQDVQEYSTTHGYVNAVDLARIVTGSSDAVFAFSPPSFRRYLDTPETIMFPAEKVQSTVVRRAINEERDKEEEESSSESIADEEGKDENPSDYSRMLAWEQGRMDYLGQDSSDNVMKRIDHLIRKGHRSS